MMSDERERGWLLLIHQLPPAPAYIRVKVSRRLQHIGAVPLKSTVYVLPHVADCYEDFQWLRGEIVADGGEATICEARFLDGYTDADVVALFHDVRDNDWRALQEELEALLASLEHDDAPARIDRDLARLRRRVAEVTVIDFFGAPKKEAVEALLVEAEARARALRTPAATAPQPAALDRYRGRTWVTREKMKVDRLASAWLIRRFIDAEAKLKLVPATGYRPKEGEVLFDMFEQVPGPRARFELFTHEGGLCTFEVLLQRMGLDEPGLKTLAEIVHDIDVKDGLYGRVEAAGFAALISGICGAHDDDDTRLARASSALDDLYGLFSKRAAERNQHDNET